MYPSQQQAQPDAAAPAPSAHVQDLLQHGTTMAELKAAGKIPSAGNFGPNCLSNSVWVAWIF